MKADRKVRGSKGDIEVRLSSILAGLMLFGASINSVWGQPAAIIRVGHATSEQQFVNIQESIQAIVPLNSRATFVYCVCEADRGRIVYAYGLEGTNPDNILADCILAARACGGCFRPPASVSIAPSPNRVQAELDRTMETEAGAFVGVDESDGMDGEILGTRTLGKSRFRRSRDD